MVIENNILFYKTKISDIREGFAPIQVIMMDKNKRNDLLQEAVIASTLLYESNYNLQVCGVFYRLLLVCEFKKLSTVTPLIFMRW